MSIGPSTFRPLPAPGKVAASVAQQRAHAQDVTSYLCYLIPLAAKFGPRVYDVAVLALQEGGMDVTAGELKSLAAELSSPDGAERYREARLRHTGTYVTSCKGNVSTFMAE